MPRSYNQSTCPVACSLDLLGDRWTLLIIRDLFRKRHRFADLQASLTGVPSNVLSDRLKLLENEGIVERRFYSQHPPRAEYYLTRKGIDLRDVLRALVQWGSTHLVDEGGSRLVHRPCGHTVEMRWACEECGEADVGRDVVLQVAQPVEEATPV
jgi:DNA-binding HxlR family transcriptional regulator